MRAMPVTKVVYVAGSTAYPYINQIVWEGLRNEYKGTITVFGVSRDRTEILYKNHKDASIYMFNSQEFFDKKMAIHYRRFWGVEILREHGIFSPDDLFLKLQFDFTAKGVTDSIFITKDFYEELIKKWGLSS
jgi:hypothetical protein